MLGRETVIFITEKNEISASLVKNELNKDISVLAITVKSSSLRSFFKSHTKKTRRILKLYVKKPICALLRKIFPKIKEVATPVYYDELKKKKIHNMLFRYSPTAIAVSDINTLYSIKQAMGANAQSVKFFVFSDGIYVDEKLADKSVFHYFVDNVSTRNDLISKGVFAENVTVECLPVESKYFSTKSSGASKENLGFATNRNLTLLCPDKKNYRKMIDYAAAHIECTDYAVITDEAEIHVYAGTKGIVSFHGSRNPEEVFNAADLIVTQFDDYTVKKAAARGKPAVIIGKTDEERTVAYLEGARHVKYLRSLSDLAEYLYEFFGRGGLISDETDEQSAVKIAEKIKELLLGERPAGDRS